MPSIATMTFKLSAQLMIEYIRPIKDTKSHITSLRRVCFAFGSLVFHESSFISPCETQHHVNVGSQKNYPSVSGGKCFSLFKE